MQPGFIHNRDMLVFNPHERTPVCNRLGDFLPRNYRIVTEEQAEELRRGGQPLVFEGDPDFPPPFKTYGTPKS
jgi:hypothetical protein